MLGVDTENGWPQPVKSAVRPFKIVINTIRGWIDFILDNSGILLLLLLQFFNSIMATTCKLLVTDDEFGEPFHPIQILFVRMVITYACCLLYMAVTKSVPDAPWGPREKRVLLLLRGGIGFFGVFGLYFSLQYLSLSDAVAITFLIPMITATLAFILLREAYLWLEAGCSVVSLGGVLLIAKPDFVFGPMSGLVNEEIESSNSEKRLLASIVGLCGVLGASCVYIILRKIGPGIHPLILVLYFALMCIVVTTVVLIVTPGLNFVLPHNQSQWTLLALIGFLGFFMQFCLTAGIQRVKAGRAAMISYTNMFFSIIWDIAIWHHLPGFLSFLGTLLIMGNAYIVLKYKPHEQDKVGPQRENAPADEEAAPADVPDKELASLEAILLQDFSHSQKT